MNSLYDLQFWTQYTLIICLYTVVYPKQLGSRGLASCFLPADGRKLTTFVLNFSIWEVILMIRSHHSSKFFCCCETSRLKLPSWFKLTSFTLQLGLEVRVYMITSRHSKNKHSAIKLWKIDHLQLLSHNFTNLFWVWPLEFKVQCSISYLFRSQITM